MPGVRTDGRSAVVPVGADGTRSRFSSWTGSTQAISGAHSNSTCGCASRILRQPGNDGEPRQTARTCSCEAEPRSAWPLRWNTLPRPSTSERTSFRQRCSRAGHLEVIWTLRGGAMKQASSDGGLELLNCRRSRRPEGEADAFGRAGEARSPSDANKDLHGFEHVQGENAGGCGVIVHLTWTAIRNPESDSLIRGCL